jgi:hypothetical protein
MLYSASLIIKLPLPPSVLHVKADYVLFYLPHLQRFLA